MNIRKIAYELSSTGPIGEGFISEIEIPIACPNLVIPEELINPRPDQEITLHKLAIPLMVGYERYNQRMKEIEQEISEKEFYYP